MIIERKSSKALPSKERLPREHGSDKVAYHKALRLIRYVMFRKASSPTLVQVQGESDIVVRGRVSDRNRVKDIKGKGLVRGRLQQGDGKGLQ